VILGEDIECEVRRGRETFNHREASFRERKSLSEEEKGATY